MSEQSPITHKTFEFFEKYRAKVKEVKDVKELMRKIQQDAQAEITRLYTHTLALEKECVTMRRIITRVIEEGIDDVEARLQGDDQTATSMWQAMHNPGGTVDQYAVTLGTRYMIDPLDNMPYTTGATGAISSIQNPYQITTFPHNMQTTIYPTMQVSSILTPTLATSVKNTP